MEVCRKSRDIDFIALVKEKIYAHPGTSIRASTNELNVDKKTVQRCIEKDLRSKFYKLQTVHLLTEAG